MNTPQDKRHTLRVTERQAVLIHRLAAAYVQVFDDDANEDPENKDFEVLKSARALCDKTWVIYERHQRERRSSEHPTDQSLSVTTLTQATA